MNTITSIRNSKVAANKQFTLTNFTLPSSLLLYSTVLEDEVDTTNNKAGEYVSKTYCISYIGSLIDSNGPPSITNANIGSYKFIDSSTYGTMTNSLTFNSGGAVTICFWFKLTSTTGNGSVKFPFIFGQTFGTNVITPEFNYNASGVLTNLFVYCLNTSGARFTPNTSLLNNWVHFAIVVSHGTVAKAYINNTLFNSLNGTNNFNAGSTMVDGRIPQGTTTVPFGNVTEIRIYNTALTATQIGNIYNWSGVGQPVF